MKQVSGTMKLDLAQYREMAAFSQFASDLDKSTKQLLSRGEALTELLKQPVYHPMRVEDEIVSIYAGVNGYLDDMLLSDIRKFENEALNELKLHHPNILKKIRENKELTDEKKDLIELIHPLKLIFEDHRQNPTTLL